MIAKHLDGQLFYYCPGCGHGHSIPVDGNGPANGNWVWDGNEATPSISPSVRHHDGKGKTFCHYWIKAGHIEFCNDSAAHALRGSHPLPDFPSGYGLGSFTVP